MPLPSPDITGDISKAGQEVPKPDVESKPSQTQERAKKESIADREKLGFQGLKDRIYSERETIERLIDTSRIRVKINVETGDPPISPEDALKVFEEWTTKTGDSPATHLEAGTQVIARISSAEDSVIDIAYALEQKLASLRNDLREIDSKIGAKASNAFRQAIATVNKRRLQGRSVHINKLIEEVNQARDKQYEVRQNLHDKLYQAEAQQREIIISQASKGILEITNSGNAYLGTLLQDSDFIAKILQGVDMGYGGSTSPEDRAKDALREFLAQSVSGMIQDDILDPLLKSKALGSNDYSLRDALGKAFPVLDPQEDAFPFLVKSSLTTQYRSGVRTRALDAWETIRKTDAMRQMFGDSVDRVDDEFFKIALNSSLNSSDHYGNMMSNLAYFPRPEALRLVLLTTASEGIDGYAYHANNANRVLVQFTRNSELFKDASQVYPEMEGLQNFLKSWDGRDQDALQKGMRKFTLAQYREDNSAFILSALPTEDVCSLAIERGTFSAEYGQALRDAIKTLDDLDNSSRINSFHREIRKEALAQYSDTESTPNPLLLEFAQGIKKYKENPDALGFLTGYTIQSKLLSPEADPQAVQFIYNFPDMHPQVLSWKDAYYKLLLDRSDTYLNPEGISYLISMHGKYPAEWIQKVTDAGTLSAERLAEIVKIAPDVLDETASNYVFSEPALFLKTNEDIEFLRSILRQPVVSGKYTPHWLARENSSGVLSRERLVELPTIAPDIFEDDVWKVASNHPQVFLQTDESVNLLRGVVQNYKLESIRQDVAESLSKGMDHETVLNLPLKCRWVNNKGMDGTVRYVLDNNVAFLQRPEDIEFVNRIVATSGNRAEELLRSYKECIDEGVIEPNEQGIILDFVKEFRVISPQIIEGYKLSREGGYESVYLSELKSIAEKMTGAGELTGAERSKPYYKDLIKHVFPHNSGNWTSYERNESCEDRTSDLAGFQVEPRYEIDLLSQSVISLKQGEVIDPEVLQKLQEPVYAIQKKLQDAGGDVDKLRGSLAQDIEAHIERALEQGRFSGLDMPSLSIDQKLFLLASESVYGTNGIDRKALQEIMVTYEFAHFEDVAGFITGTQDRVSRASNQDYALLCELSQFYSDRIKDVNKRIVEAGYSDPKITEYMKTYFKELSQNEQLSGRQEKINKLQIGKLGMSPGFIAQAGRVLEGRYGRKLTTEEVTKIISRYESVAGGLVEKTSISPNKPTQALYGTLRTQRERTFDALKLIAGSDIDPKTVHLGEINLQQALDTEEQVIEGVYSPEQFAAYTAQRFIDIFENERDVIDLNLSKFESESGKNREVLYGYVSKNHETANARMVGGVCVSGDNPDKGTDNMWDMPNYLQLVLQDPVSLQSQGLVLLHHFTDRGKRVLTASFNPSSTYLYSVDERALFSGMQQQLEKFAKDNGFDMILTSSNHTIRTNRTGGEFERAINDRIKDANKQFSFTDNQQFSYSPNYQLKDMDVIWENQET